MGFDSSRHHQVLAQRAAAERREAEAEEAQQDAENKRFNRTVTDALADVVKRTK